MLEETGLINKEGTNKKNATDEIEGMTLKFSRICIKWPQDSGLGKHVEHSFLKLELGECGVHEGLLYVSDRVFVPDEPELRTDVIREIHDTPPGGHAGRSSTYERLNTHYLWPRMTDSVARYVKSCYVCKRAKAYRDGKQGLLKPVPIPVPANARQNYHFITPI